MSLTGYRVLCSLHWLYVILYIICYNDNHLPCLFAVSIACFYPVWLIMCVLRWWEWEVLLMCWLRWYISSRVFCLTCWFRWSAWLVPVIGCNRFFPTRVVSQSPSSIHHPLYHMLESQPPPVSFSSLHCLFLCSVAYHVCIEVIRGVKNERLFLCVGCGGRFPWIRMGFHLTLCRVFLFLQCGLSYGFLWQCIMKIHNHFVFLLRVITWFK